MNMRLEIPLIALLGPEEKSEAESFHQELEASIHQLVESIRKTRSVKDLAGKLHAKGGWSSLLGIFSGSNDKDLASMLGELGASLETTQVVLTAFLRMQTHKDGLLRTLHSTLVDKLRALQGDTTTLDENQRAVAIQFVRELRDLVFLKLEQQEKIERHERHIHELDDFAKRARACEQRDAERFGSLEEADRQLARQHAGIVEEAAAHGVRLSSLEDENARLTTLAREAAALIDAGRKRQAEQGDRIRQLEVSLSNLEASHVRQAADLETNASKVADLEALRVRDASARALALRHAPGALALVVAAGMAVMTWVR